MENLIKISICVFAGIILTAVIGFPVFEPIIGNAASDTASVTAVVSEEVTITSPDDVLAFNASIPGVSGNPGAPVYASLTWNVKTNNASGFNMNLAASSSPAMKHTVDGSTYFFDNYTAGVPAYNWTSPAVGGAKFGFTVKPATSTDIATAFKDDGSSSCGSGSYHSEACWSGFNGTNTVTVINRTIPTSASGEDEEIKFYVESNGRLLEEGDYTATITATAALNS